MILSLSFCHLGMFALLAPAFLTLSVLGIVVLVMSYRVNNLIGIVMSNLEIFVPITLLFASLIYMKQKYIKRATQSELFAAQKQEIQKQEIQRANMVRYLDMITTEQFSKADILSKISTEQAKFFADMEPEKLQHMNLADTKAMDLAKKHIKSIIAAHYGYYLDRFTLEQKGLQTFIDHQCHTSPLPKLVILPQNSSVLQKDIIVHMPHAKRSTKDAKIMSDTIMKMLEFQHFMVNAVKLNQSILANILYLLKKVYDLQKHDSGQLLLLRTIGIVKEVATFTLDHMITYASLLYDYLFFPGCLSLTFALIMISLSLLMLKNFHR